MNNSIKFTYFAGVFFLIFILIFTYMDFHFTYALIVLFAPFFLGNDPSSNILIMLQTRGGSRWKLLGGG